MAAIVVNQGLQRLAINASQATGYDSARYIRSMAVDDSSVAFTATDTALNSGGAVANSYAAAFDSTPSRTNQTVSHVMTIPTGSGNFTIRRISLHDLINSSVSVASTSLVAGIDGQSLTKTSDFTMEITMTLSYTDNS